MLDAMGNTACAIISISSEAELGYFLWSALEQMVEYIIETPVSWDAIAPIMTSLYWYWDRVHSTKYAYGVCYVMSPVGHQAITCANTYLLSTGPLQTKLFEILIKFWVFSLQTVNACWTIQHSWQWRAYNLRTSLDKKKQLNVKVCVWMHFNALFCLSQSEDAC